MGAAARGVLIVHLEDDEDLHERTPPTAAPSWPELHGADNPHRSASQSHKD